MKTKLLYINYFVILTTLQLAGCSTLQRATYSEPIVESEDIQRVRYADGIAFEHLGICVAVREGMFGAEYRNLFAGPLMFPIFPLEIIAPSREYTEFTFYEITLDFVPLENTKLITFDPTKVVLKLNDGTTLIPYANQFNGTSFSQLQPLTLLYHEEITLRFRKGNNNVEMSELHLNGLYQQGAKLDFPKVKFGPRTTHYRLLHGVPFYGGQYRNNVPGSHSLQHGIQPIPPKCHH